MSGGSSIDILQSVQALSQVMQMATSESIDMAMKLVKLELQTTLGSEIGKGELLDILAE